ncbi:MAG: hypothetical protein GY907_10535 [Bacteroidetes bacterium]|nr:hypothetical protein [Bacteroidota bacterium]
MKYYFLKTTVVILFTAVVFSCSNSNENGYKRTKNGVLIKRITEGPDSTKAKESEIVTIRLKYRLNDSIIFNSDDIEDGSMVFPITKPIFEGDLYEALTLMGTGDSISIGVVADSFFLKSAAMQKLPEYVTPGSIMYYDIKLLDHKTSSEWQKEADKKSLQMAKQEMATLQIYLNNNKIYTDPTVNGLYFLEEKKGRGSTADTGDICQVYLSVKVLGSDNILFSNFNDKPLDFEFGQDFDTKGFREGIGLMKPGGKARFIVPSWIGISSEGQGIIDPFTTLEYEVELISIRSPADVTAE